MIVVGCPVKDRAWIIEPWFDHLVAALFASPASALMQMGQVQLVFVGDPHTDRATFSLIDRCCLRYSLSRDVIEIDEAPLPYHRVWNTDRYHHMVELRNMLLTHVRTYEPTMFWSVDSDVLMHPESLRSAMNALERFDAVGSKIYMTPNSTACPSFAMKQNGGLLRWDDSGCFPVDIIMGVKLMSPMAYAVDYVHHIQGEDIGWSERAQLAGCKLGWDGTYTSRHVMAPEYLNQPDDRV